MDKLDSCITRELILMAPHMCALNKYYYHRCKEVFTNPTLMERVFVPGQHQMAAVYKKIDERLSVAAEKGQVQVVKALLRAGADVDAWAGGAVVCAARYGHVEVLDVLLKAGASTHFRRYGALDIAKSMRDGKIQKGEDTSEYDKIIRTLSVLKELNPYAR
ncbi:Kinase D-interacting substrate [Tetrabaena socialis]|uniref:Kinase D-interacting substrate n=1 Tax=Tetrabaena socialis TaxID=47790 RepID=A0A2J8ADD4_9CHLO|nr:Kinase D-interacting substrate [Tetrabaena socialis]|eukprot:PNH10530.1 Kinase D-interacting substrate [Tetrabaena socialis]